MLKSLILFCFMICASAKADTNLAVHLLSYLAQDYGEAVRDGKILSQSEFDEQLEFVAEVVRSGEQEKFPADIQVDVVGLQKIILSKASPLEVSRLATDLRWRLIRHYQIPTSPLKDPDIEFGKTLYAKNCASCHGINGFGDGEDGKGLDPAPANFHDQGRFTSVSPFQAFTTITLGVPGTGMRAFTEFNELERWSLAAYVLDFHYEGAAPEKPKIEVTQDDRWSLSDKELQKKYDLANTGELRFVRKLEKRSEEAQSELSLNLAISKLEESLLEYRNGKREKASKLAFESYLEGVEPIEPLIGQGKIAEIETGYFSYRSLIREKSSEEKLTDEHAHLTKKLEAIRPLLSQKHAFLQSLLFSFGIVFREMLEAALVILLLLSMLRKLDASESSTWIHGGWISAVLLGFGLALVLDKSLEESGVLIENLEGYIGIIAVGMLLWLALWLHGHGQIEQWKAYLRDRVTNHLLNRQMLGLSLISFTAVFREMIETILFIKILRINGHSEVAITSGVISTVIVTTALVFVMLKLSVKVNIAKLMRLSTAALLFFAFTLLGKSIHALQLTGTLRSTEAFSGGLPVLGIYGTWESLGSQIILIVLMIGIIVKKKKI